MTPTSYTVKDNVTYFHYPYPELIDFVRTGCKHGDNGMILTKRQDSLFTYKGFGTYENPRKNILTFISRNLNFGGEDLTDDEQLIPPTVPKWLSEMRCIVIDLSNYKKP